MLKNNEGFECSGCGKIVSKAEKTCRNHCPYCFLSMHVDHVPGDRASDCRSVMIPVSYMVANGIIKIQFCCTKCFHVHNNKAASDDHIAYLDEWIKKWKRTFPNCFVKNDLLA